MSVVDTSVGTLADWRVPKPSEIIFIIFIKPNKVRTLSGRFDPIERSTKKKKEERKQ